MSKVVMIAATVAVAAILVGGGLAVALPMLTNDSGNGSNSTPNNPDLTPNVTPDVTPNVTPNVTPSVTPSTPTTNDPISFENHYFDLSGAQSLAIVKESTVMSSNTATQGLTNIGTKGAALPSFGDPVTTSEDNALYKKNQEGVYEKVKLYKDKETMDAKGEEDNREYVPLTLNISDNGKYALISIGIKPPSYYYSGGQEVYHIIGVIVSLETGKIYPLPDETDQNSYTNVNYDNWYADYNTYLFGYMYWRQYQYFGSSDSVIYLTYSDNNVCYLFAAVEKDNELVLTEIFNNKVIKNSGPYKIYNHDIIRIFNNTLWNNTDSYLVFADGSIKSVTESSVFECGGNLCTAVTYYDPITKYFPSSATIIVGYDTELHTFVTETVDYTQEEAYNVATQTIFESEIYKEVGTDSTILVTMSMISTITKVRLNNDCTFDDLGETVLPFQLGSYNQSSPVYDDTGNYYDEWNDIYVYYYKDTYDYKMMNNHICQYYGDQSCCGVVSNVNVGDMIVNDGFIYKVIGNSLKRYNLISGGDVETIMVPELVAVSSLDIEGGRAILEGLSDSGKMISGTLDFSTGDIDLQHSNILREVKIEALS